MYFEPQQNVGVFLVGSLKPGKCLVVVAESQISVHKGGSRNVPGLLAFFQFLEEPKCISASPGVGISPHQHPNNAWATGRNRNRLLQNGATRLLHSYSTLTASHI